MNHSLAFNPLAFCPLRSRPAAFARGAGEIVSLLTIRLAALTAGLAGAACTTTPSYFPPCVENAPCDAPDSAADASGATDAPESGDAAPADGPAEAR